MRNDRGTWLPKLLSSVEAAEPVAAVRAFASELGRLVGAEHVSFLFTDFSGQSLIRMPQRSRHRGPGDGAAEQVPMSDEDLPYRRAALSRQVQVLPEPDLHRPGGVRVLMPVSTRGDVMGVLDLALPRPPDAGVQRILTTAAHALALVITAERRHTDLYEWGQRSRPVSLAAEIQRRLLPDALTCEAGAFTLAAWLEPAGSIGGDTFDYSLEPDRLYLSMTDAMGHEVDAALLATLAVGSLRNSRRTGRGLQTMARLASESIEEHRRGMGIVTGVLMSIGLDDGRAEIVNAGHPLPLLQRSGTVRPLPLNADFPFGILPEAGYRLQRATLQPGDRLIVLTDGMLERNAATLDLPALITASRDQHPHQLIQTLAAAVYDATGGQLNDDATALCLDWRGSGSVRSIVPEGPGRQPAASRHR